MKKTIIPAGTHGIFRLDHGQYPERDARIDLWLNTAKGRIRIQSVGRNLPANPAAYAWSYAPTPPPVDGFEAFCQKWESFGGGMGICGPYLWWSELELLTCDTDAKYNIAANLPTLEAAQRAAYNHFLASLQDAP